MKKIIFSILISLLLPVSSAHAFNMGALGDHFRIHHAAIGATLGFLKGGCSLMFEKKMRKLSFAKKAEYLSKCTFYGLVIGSLGGAYVNAVLKNCQTYGSVNLDNHSFAAFSQDCGYQVAANYNSTTRKHYMTSESILGITRQDSPEAIRKKYRRLSLKFHPDKYTNKEVATQITAALNTARDDLMRMERY